MAGPAASSTPSSTWARFPTRPPTTASWSWIRISAFRSHCSTGARQPARPSSMRLRQRPMATAIRASTTMRRRNTCGQLRPMNLYGWSKHLFDQALVARRLRGEKLPPQWAGLKFFNVFGPNEYHKGKMASVLSKVFDDAKAGGSRASVQVAQARHRRRRPAARLHLCRRRGGGGALVDGHAARFRACSMSEPARRAAFAR